MTIEISGAVKRFAGKPAVDGVSACIADGEFFVVLGASGCGKSTLLRLIAGLEVLDEGKIALAGRTVAGPSLHVAPEDRGTGFVFQSYALWPHMNVAENVAFPIEARGGGRTRALKEAVGHIASVALDGYEQRRPAELSGGQRQRVALARCLAGGARTVLMDEPLANLDPHLRAAMEHELARFHAETGATTVYITHDQREAMALADRIAVMADGRFLQVATPREIYARPTSEAVARFIGRSAIVEARIVRDDGAARAAFGPFAAHLPGDPRAQADCGRVVIRPGDVKIGGTGAAEGRVVAASYRGEAWEALVAVPGLAEPLPVTAAAPLAAGDGCAVSVTSCWLLPEG